MTTQFFQTFLHVPDVLVAVVPHEVHLGGSVRDHPVQSLEPVALGVFDYIGTEATFDSEFVLNRCRDLPCRL